MGKAQNSIYVWPKTSYNIFAIRIPMVSDQIESPTVAEIGPAQPHFKCPIVTAQQQAQLQQQNNHNCSWVETK